AKYFPPEAKAKAQELVSNLLKAYDADIRTLDWMTDATRAKALEKLHKFTVKIGYPDHWRDYSALKIDRANLIGSYHNWRAFEWTSECVPIHQRDTPPEWGMAPPPPNA